MAVLQEQAPGASASVNLSCCYGEQTCHVASETCHAAIFEVVKLLVFLVILRTSSEELAVTQEQARHFMTGWCTRQDSLALLKVSKSRVTDRVLQGLGLWGSSR